MKNDKYELNADDTQRLYNEALYTQSPFFKDFKKIIDLADKKVKCYLSK